MLSTTPVTLTGNIVSQFNSQLKENTVLALQGPFREGWVGK